MRSPELTGASAIPSVIITGTVPEGAGAPWKGTYTVSGGTGLCTIAGTGSFASTALGDVTGTYAGTAAGFFFPSQSEHGTEQAFALSLELKQGSALFALGASQSPYSKLAVTGALAVQGISCFSKGTSSPDAQSLVLGSHFIAAFTMDDGSRVTVSGEMAARDASALRLLALGIDGGACAGNYSFGLTPPTLMR